MARDSDICCRYGDEELAVILPLTDLQKAEVIANRMREVLAEKFPDGRVSAVSIGIATCGKKVQAYQTFLEHADTALYLAKKEEKTRWWLLIRTHC